jgi:predicted ATPase
VVPEAPQEPVGRAVEAAALARFAEGLRDRSAAVLVRGEPGIGKTTLWRHAVAAAEASGVLVLAVGCVEAEMPIAMCALADLLEPVLGDVLDELPTSQREALSGALGLETGARLPADRIALPRAVMTALGALTERAPVLVAVDDAQWLDPASGRLLAFSLRRLVDRPLGALITLRGGPGAPDPLALTRCFGSA